MAPSIYFSYAYSPAIEGRISNLWRIHENREKRGLEGTKKSHGMYDRDQHTMDSGMQHIQNFFVRWDTITNGYEENPYFANQFVRMNKAIEQYPDDLSNSDDYVIDEVDNFERAKPFMPPDNSVIGTTSVIPYQDTDEKYIHNNALGETLYSNPPNPNNPLVDHGIDEKNIWNFRKTIFNQFVIENTYNEDNTPLDSSSHAPWWGMKLQIPTWYKKEKYAKFLKQWQIRLDFEALKKRQAIERIPGDNMQLD